MASIETESFACEKGEKDVLTTWQRIIKRTFDIALGIVSIVVFAPVMAVIWVAIRLEDGEPAIYSQERIGYKGKKFNIYKFRSMRTDAESDGIPELNTKNDDRVTKVGSFIRAHHLDEFPQLWNVLKGEMSFVGPRPEREYFIRRIETANPDYKLLYRVRPGLFSMATLYNGYTDTLGKMLKRLEMDLNYMENYSFWLDLKILFLTSVAIITGKIF